MTIRLLSQYDNCPPNSIITLDGGTEAGMVAAKQASTDLTGGTPFVPQAGALHVYNGPFTVRARRARKVALAEGLAITVTGAAGATGTVARLDASDAVLQTWTVGAGVLPPIGPFSGTQKILLTCTVGSIDATVGDAVLTIPPPKSDAGNTLGLLGDSITHNNYIQSTISAISRSSGVVTVTLTGSASTAPGLPVQVVGVPEDMRGNQTVVSVSGSTFTYANAGPDVASGTLGSFPRAAIMSRFADVGIITWGNILSKQKFDIVAVSASTGRFTDEALARVQEIISAAPVWCHVMIGTNDCASAEATAPLATAQSNVRQIWAALLNAGIKVIAATIPPQGAAAWNATTTARVLQFNEWLRREARKTAGVTLVDYHAVMVDPLNANKGQAKAGYMITGDGLHPAPRGAYYAGKEFARVMAFVPFVDRRTMSNADNYGTNSASSNLIDSAPWTASGGTLAGTATGAAGAQWTHQGNGTVVTSCTPTLRPDGFGYDHVITAKPLAANDIFITYTSGINIVARLPAAPFQLQLFVDISVSGMLAANYSNFNAYMPMTIGGVVNRNIEALAATGSVIGDTVDEDWTGVLATPRLTFKTAPTSIAIYNQPTCVALSANTATFKIGRETLMVS